MNNIMETPEEENSWVSPSTTRRMADLLNLTIGQSQGRIRVYCRARHFDASALSERGGCGVECGGAEQEEITVRHRDEKRDKDVEATFGFDHVFSPETTNTAVFEEVGRPLVTSVLCGYNATLMAYGQTGSGKTHSLASGDGLINTMVGHLYRSISENEAAKLFRVSVSYVQVYNEKVYDLLHPSNPDKALSLRENKKKEGGVYVEGVSEHRAANVSELLELLAFGRSRLHFAETRMNRHSSRSHAVCMITVQRTVGAKASPTATGESERAEAPDKIEPVAERLAESHSAGPLAAIEAAAEEEEERAAAERALSQAVEAGEGSEVAVVRSLPSRPRGVPTG